MLHYNVWETIYFSYMLSNEILRFLSDMGNFYLQYQYTLPVFSDKALSLK